MKNYELKIDGMHCNACKILITEELEENGLQNIDVDLEKGLVILSDANEFPEVENKVKNAFMNLDQYKIININLIN